MDEVAALRQQLAEGLNERDLLSKGIADAACKLGITSEGVALTGPHLLMLLGDMVGMVEAAARQGEPVAWDVLTTGNGSWCKTVRGRETAEAAANRGFRIEPLYRHAKPAMAKVDENTEFERWRKDQCESLERMGCPYAAQKFHELGSIHWAGWQARANLKAAPE